MVWRSRQRLSLIALVATAPTVVNALVPHWRGPNHAKAAAQKMTLTAIENEDTDDGRIDVTRRNAFSAATISALSLGGVFQPAFAETLTESVEMKTFVDPQGMFAINVPKRFFTLRRSAKGDLPDAKGKGRRGSTIFSAGDMAKAEILAVERFPTDILLLDNGIEPSGTLASITDIGNPTAVAKLLALKRDREKDGAMNTKVVSDSIVMSDDKNELTFILRTQIDVQRPELLMEQTGVSELYRVTAAKASLQAGDGLMMVVYASALETDWKGPDGEALREAVKSFKVLN